ncbi:hypothetical protein AB1Y20_006833 [Prymnesium parvum]|uniref:HIT-type domain-containing protein n=1 Tax=Prymnesium parvum TaxID=97485 RepID=A0AB34J1W6_PRYPA
MALFASAPRVCAVCTKNFSKYKCPRCALAYCSSACYRNHGERCTEAFYHELAKGELKASRASSEQASEMLQTLRRLEGDAPALWNAAGEGETRAGEEGADEEGTEEEGEGEEEGEEAERLLWMLQQAHLSEDQLPPELRTEFRRLRADGSLAAQLQALPAWWTQLSAHSVERMRSGWQFTSEAAAAAAKAAGVSLPNPPALLQLTRKEPPASIRFNLLDMVLAYCYTYRLYCGAPEDDPLPAAEAMLQLSAVLNGEVRGAHGSAEEAMLEFASRSEHRNVSTSHDFGTACTWDAKTVLGDCGIVALALGSAESLAGEAAKLCRSVSGQQRLQKRQAPRDGACSAPRTERDPQPERTDSNNARQLEAGQLEGEDALGLLQSLKLAKKKLGFMGAWWASLDQSERCTHLAGLQFALQREAERRANLVAIPPTNDSVNTCASSPSPTHARTPGPLIQELD